MCAAPQAANAAAAYLCAMHDPSAQRITFGEFVFDVASGDLHANGKTTRLAPQTAAVLRVLAARSGQVVSRTELREALWPNTTVEFDQGLNFCVRQLRVALSDDAAEPKYIETLHRRGYRFVADVRPLVSYAPRDVAVSAPPMPPRRSSLAWYWPPAIVLVAVVVAVAALMNARHYEPERRLAVLYFDAPDNDPMLARYRAQLAEALVATAGRGHLNEVAVMGPSFTVRFAGTSTPPDTIRAAIGATHVLSGVLRRDGDATTVFAQLIRTSDRRHIYAARFVDSTSSASKINAIADSIARAATMIVLRE